MKPDGSTLTSQSLADVLRRRGVREVTLASDRRTSISSGVVRGVLDGRLIVGVGGDYQHPVSAFTDLIDLHLRAWAPPDAEVTVPDEIDFYLARNPQDPETPDALRTLAAAVRDVRARVLTVSVDGDVHPLPADAPHFGDATGYGYTGWASLLSAIPADPPELVTRLVTEAAIPALRAYPMLSRRGRAWSIRLEGLQVGVLTARRGLLAVGKDRDEDHRSGPRRAWVNVAGVDAFEVTPTNLADAAQLLVRFEREWPNAANQTAVVQDEHALESRILRGAVNLTSEDGRPLTALNPRGDRTPTPDPIVNWGSQFPTRWGPRKGAGRYLDGLLRDGATPWAIEMKVRGAQGVGQYYRHAVHQAVLYREFIRTATPLASWFERQGLAQAGCRAAVVTPQGDGRVAEHLNNARRVAAAFGVDFLTVDERAAQRHPDNLERQQHAGTGPA